MPKTMAHNQRRKFELVGRASRGYLDYSFSDKTRCASTTSKWRGAAREADGQQLVDAAVEWARRTSTPSSRCSFARVLNRTPTKNNLRLHDALVDLSGDHARDTFDPALLVTTRFTVLSSK